MSRQERGWRLTGQTHFEPPSGLLVLLLLHIAVICYTSSMTISYVYTLSAQSETLYVGVTNNLTIRFANHQSTKSWWRDVDRIEVLPYKTREDAGRKEALLIRELSPKYNEKMSTKANLPYSRDEAAFPKTHAPLPEEEIDYLKTLSSDETYARCAELQEVGWSVPAMLAGAKVSPTPAQLRVELKYRKPVPTGRPVPPIPLTEVEERKNRIAVRPHLTTDEAARLKEYAEVSKKLRAHHGPGSTEWDTVEEFKRYVVMLRDRGIFASEMAKAAGVNETVILRRIRQGRIS